MASDDAGTLSADTYDGISDALADDGTASIDISDSALFGDSADGGAFNAPRKRRGSAGSGRGGGRASFNVRQSEAQDFPSDALSAGVENDVAFAVQGFSKQAAKLWGDHWTFDKGETKLVTRQAARTFSQVPGMPTQFGLIANGLILAAMGALLIAPRIYITKLLIQQQRNMMMAQQHQNAAQAGMQQPPHSNGATPDPNYDPIAQYLQ